MFPYEDSKTVSVCPSVCPYHEKRNHPSFVNVSPTLVIDTSMERPSRVLATPWKPKNVNFLKKVGNQLNWILSVPRVSIRREKKSPWLCQYQSYISNWHVNRKVFKYYNMGTIFFFQKSSKLNLTCAEELKSTFSPIEDKTRSWKKNTLLSNC